MNFIKKYHLLFEILFFIGIFAVVIIPLRDFDIWFHLKSGELILQKGIIHYDVFSYVTQGREWFPYEWLFQVTLYLWKSLFGFESIKFLIAFFVTLMNVVIYLMLRRFFKLHILYSFLVCFIFTASVFEFFTARPHIFAYTFLLTNLFFILLYYFERKNLLFITLLITLAWANLHGSIFLDVALFGGYTVVCLLNYFILKEQKWIHMAKVLGIYTVATTFLTVLPPLGILQYRLLVDFFLKRNLISHFISEWVPLSADPFGFWFYSVSILIIIVVFFIVVINKKVWKHTLWVLPLLPFFILAYLANRNVFLAYISAVLIIGWIFSQIPFRKLMIIVIALVVVVHIWFISEKRSFAYGERLYYPVHATEFIKENLKGNMFNEYGYGGYLLYNLYPDQKVFIDGRTDLYLCCEIPDLMEMTTLKRLPDKDYKTYLDSLWNKYNISFVVMRTEKNTVMRKVGNILSNNPDWSLVFWDDHSEIFVRRDGKNSDIIEKYAAAAVTPYERNPVRPGMDEKALAEYQRMIDVVDSAKSRNAIGYLDLKKGDFDDAQVEFGKATTLDPTFESPYMNLAELAVKYGQLNEAVDLYLKAYSLAPDRGLIYIRLGQLMLQRNDDPQKVKKLWEAGLKNTVDQDAKKKLVELIATL